MKRVLFEQKLRADYFSFFHGSTVVQYFPHKINQDIKYFDHIFVYVCLKLKLVVINH